MCEDEFGGVAEPLCNPFTEFQAVQVIPHNTYFKND